MKQFKDWFDIGLVPKIQKFLCSNKFMPNHLKKIIMHRAGPFTVFFWMPAIKWGLSIKFLLALTNLNQTLRKPVQQVSSMQQVVICLTGGTWMLYSFRITPINLGLASVNLFLCLTGIYQLYRKYQAGQLIE